MVGEGVLHECLLSDKVAAVLIINRKPSGFTDPKLTEIIHEDFFNLRPIADQLSGYDTCLFCLGVSSVGMKEPEYYRITYTLTLHVAEILVTKNPNMTFCYISGAHTDQSEKGKIMWARVKGKTENDLTKVGFKNVYNFRPGILEPTKGLKNTLKMYKYLGWLAPIIRAIAPNQISTLKELGLAMINASAERYDHSTIEIKDIKVLAAK